MSFIKDIFQGETTFNAVIYSKSQTETNGRLGAITWNPELIIECMFWVASTGIILQSEQLRQNVDAKVVVDPADVTVSIQNGWKMQVNGIDYSIVYADDVALQGEVTVIGLEKFR